jgi:hypothetical protein
MARTVHKKRKWRPWPGAVAAAAQLGVTYSHLRRVLSGERRSRSLVARYAALKADQAEAAKTKNSKTKEEN